LNMKPTKLEFQDLEKFEVPPGFRGRSRVTVLFWQITQATLFGLSPQPLYGWRRMLLRLFGAKVGRKVLVRPTARITFPWKVEIAECSWIGDDVGLYSLDKITIGRHAVISQRSYLCTASHDEENIAFPYKTAPIEVGDEAWIASDVFVGPGVTVGRGAVIGARSTVFDAVPASMIAFGSPAKVQRVRPASGRQPGEATNDRRSKVDQ
jgi:putative colanic acid biosynthesis acetyltransferase WcaF